MFHQSWMAFGYRRLLSLTRFGSASSTLMNPVPRHTPYALCFAENICPPASAVRSQPSKPTSLGRTAGLVRTFFFRSAETSWRYVRVAKKPVPSLGMQVVRRRYTHKGRNGKSPHVWKVCAEYRQVQHTRRKGGTPPTEQAGLLARLPLRLLLPASSIGFDSCPSLILVYKLRTSHD